jgi:hypothetical protein
LILKNLRENEAACVIQKHCKAMIAKKDFEIIKKKDKVIAKFVKTFVVEKDGD